jgi:hypothetical protein
VGLFFRIARSQILIKPVKGETAFQQAVIDPLDTGDQWHSLPNNKDWFYKVRITQEEDGAVERTVFQQTFNKSLRIFPVPSCARATVSLGAKSNTQSPKVEFTAVATEYDYPENVGQPATKFSPLYSMKGVSNLFSTTKIDITKYENTELPKAIGVEVTDNTAKLITGLAGLAKAVISMVVVTDNDIQDNTIVENTLTVADNLRLKPITLPSKGKVTLHSVCNADVVDDSEASSDQIAALERLTKLIETAKEVYDAWKEDRKPPESEHETNQ